MSKKSEVGRRKSDEEKKKSEVGKIFGCKFPVNKSEIEHPKSEIR